MARPFTPSEEYSYLFDFSGGQDSGQSPAFLPPNVAAFISNGTVRGAFVKNRSCFRKLKPTFPDAATQTAFTKGLFQGEGFYKPDSGAEYRIRAVSGRFFKILADALGNETITEITGGFPQSATAPQIWMWQAEQFMIINDGKNLPVFWDGTATRRSLGQSGPVAIQTTTVKPPASGVSFAMDVSASAGLNGLTLLVGPGGGEVLVTAINTPTNIQVTNISMDPTLFYTNNKLFNADTFGTPSELPVGRMGAYVMCRVWMSLANGLEFIAGDIRGGPSGTIPYNYRDSVLKITENSYLVGSGTFSIPGSVGDIRAIIGVAQLDQMLGQGPVLVYAPDRVYSVNSPVDRLTWQSLTNPLLTVSLANGGSLTQWGTVNANSDTLSRDLVGIRSLKMARRDFNSDDFGNVPISREVDRTISQDNQSLLAFVSAAVFDNRLLMTCRPIQSTQGVYCIGMVALNFDPVSTMRGKLPSVYDGIWTGMNVLKLTTGVFSSISRCYAAVLNTDLGVIEDWEILQTADTSIIADNGTTPITTYFETAELFGTEDRRPVERDLQRLINGEIYVDEMSGSVTFRVYYQPDSYPCWIEWLSWTECADMTGPNAQLQFRPRMGLGEPSGIPCDPITNRPFREGFSFQFKIVITGKATFKGARFMAITVPQPAFSPPKCL